MGADEPVAECLSSAVVGQEPHHPWRRFAQLSDWLLRWAELPPGVMGRTCHRTRTVTLALGLSQAERRCTIAHETQHILRGPVPAQYVSHEERAVDRAAAALLLPSTRAVVAALVRARGDPEAAADELWVDEYLLAVRLESLSQDARAWLRARLTDLA